MSTEINQDITIEKINESELSTAPASVAGTPEKAQDSEDDVVDPATLAWNPNHFCGEFWDNLGHDVCAQFTSRNNKKGEEIINLEANLIKKCGDNEGSQKTLVVKKAKNKWQCGNGFFQAHESHFDKIVWETKDGKRSIWTRYAPTGPVFFDPPPMLLSEGGMVNIDMGCVLEEQIVKEDLKKFEFQAGAQEFIPFQKKLEMYTPKLKEFKASMVCTIENAELRWTLSEKPETLKKMPKDFGVNSPVFSVAEVENMQLLFLPNGRTNSESEDVCAINLLTGSLKTGTGIKFELFLNGISTGPKVCLGKRFTTELPKPQGIDIQIGFRVLDIFSELN